MTDKRDWTGKVGSTWAQEWRRTDRSFSQVTPQLLEAIEAGPFNWALDIGCGAGEIACELAQRHPDAEITGVDVAPELLEVARRRGEGLENCRFVAGDAASYTVDPTRAPDLLVSRHGVMFFPAPVAAFAHLKAQAREGARLIFSCFRARQENQWVSATLSALPVQPEPPLPGEAGPFAFGSRDHVQAILSEAGWDGIEFEPLDYEMVFGGGNDPVADATDYLTRIGPTATPIAGLGGKERAETLARLGRLLEGYLTDSIVSIPAAAWIVTARTGD